MKPLDEAMKFKLFDIIDKLKSMLTNEFKENDPNSYSTILSIVDEYYTANTPQHDSGIVSRRVKLYTVDDFNYNTESSEASDVLNGCFFHGDAQDILGHDIICVPQGIAFINACGVFPFKVCDRTHGHQILTGLLYLWKSSESSRNRGLAIADGDKSGHEYAKKCYNNRESVL